MSLGIRLGTGWLDALWYDEAFTAWLARLPLDRMMLAIASDVHPPLWYLVEWITVRVLGSSEIALRSPAALASALAGIELYRLVQRLAGEQPARLASVLFTFAPAQIYYGQEARMYAALALFVIGGYRAAIEGRNLRASMLLTLTMYTQNLGALYVAPLAAYMVIRDRQSLRSLIPAGLAYAPWGAVMFSQAADVANGFWIPSPGSIGAIPWSLIYSTVFNRVPEWMAIHSSAAVMLTTAASALALRRRWRELWPLAALVFGPPAALYGLSLTVAPVMLDRAMIPAGAALLAMWAMGLHEMSQGTRRLIGPVLGFTGVIALVGFAMPLMAGTGRADQSYFDLIRSGWQPGDAIYHTSISSAIVGAYYMSGYPSWVMPNASNLSQSLTVETKQAMGLLQMELAFDDIPARRAWILAADTPVTSDTERALIADILTHPIEDRWVIESNQYATFEVFLVEVP